MKPKSSFSDSFSSNNLDLLYPEESQAVIDLESRINEIKTPEEVRILDDDLKYYLNELEKEIKKLSKLRAPEVMSVIETQTKSVQIVSRIEVSGNTQKYIAKELNDTMDDIIPNAPEIEVTQLFISPNSIIPSGRKTIAYYQKNKWVVNFPVWL